MFFFVSVISWVSYAILAYFMEPNWTNDGAFKVQRTKNPKIEASGINSFFLDNACAPELRNLIPDQFHKGKTQGKREKHREKHREKWYSTVPCASIHCKNFCASKR